MKFVGASKFRTFKFTSDQFHIQNNLKQVAILPQSFRTLLRRMPLQGFKEARKSGNLNVAHRLHVCTGGDDDLGKESMNTKKI